MLITDKDKLQRFHAEHRIWQGIPSIEVTAGGRLFAAFYSGGTTEELGNYVVLTVSDDDGKTWSDPIAAAYRSQLYRCYDPCLWIDPLGRLWFLWAMMPDHAVYAAICDNPDAETLVWHTERPIGNDIMMNKPTVLSTGEWLFPIAVWDKTVYSPGNYISTSEQRGAFVYKSSDNGKTFQRLGTPEIAARSYDEHMVVELGQRVLLMLIRTRYGIGESFSYDGGHT